MLTSFYKIVSGKKWSKFNLLDGWGWASSRGSAGRFAGLVNPIPVIGAGCSFR